MTAGIGMLTGSCQEASGKVQQQQQQQQQMSQATQRDTCLMAQRPHGQLRTRHSVLSQASSPQIYLESCLQLHGLALDSLKSGAGWTVTLCQPLSNSVETKNRSSQEFTPAS